MGPTSGNSVGTLGGFFGSGQGKVAKIREKNFVARCVATCVRYKVERRYVEERGRTVPAATAAAGFLQGAPSRQSRSPGTWVSFQVRTNAVWNIAGRS